MRKPLWVLALLLVASPALAQSGEAERQERLADEALSGGDPEAAVRACESALRLDPSRWSCVRTLGFAYEQLNLLEEARTNLEAFRAQQRRGGLEADQEVEETLELVLEGLSLAAERSRGRVRTSRGLTASTVWPIWAAGGGGGGGVHWGRPADNPGVRVAFGGGHGSGSLLGGGGVSLGRLQVLGLAQLEVGAVGSPAALLLTVRGVAQAELASDRVAGGWLRIGGGVTPTTVREGGANVTTPVGGFVLAGGLRLRGPAQTRLLIGPELDLLPGVDGARVSLRLDVLLGPG